MAAIAGDTVAATRADGVDEKSAAIQAVQEDAALATAQVVQVEGEGGQVDETLTSPTDEELVTLRRVPNHIPLKIFTIAFIELCERFSYYGSTVVCKYHLPDQ